MAPGYPAPLDPADFTQPRSGGQQPTRHLYLAKCGRGCGDTPDSVLSTLRSAAPNADVVGLHVGDTGISYASFASGEVAQEARRGVEAATNWIVRFAEHGSEAGQRGPCMPDSVASTAHVAVPGLEVVHDFVSEAEARELLAAVDAQPWDTTIKRRVQHYGHAFDYARLEIAEGPAPQLPAFCAGFPERIAAATGGQCLVDQLTVNEYEPGVGIAFHVDAHSAFGDFVAAVTLGSGIVMQFRRPESDRDGKVSVGKHHRLAPPPRKSDRSPVLQKHVWLPANSLLLLRDEARYAWQHGIAWRTTDCINEAEPVQRGRRVSLTFRTARFRPCDCRWPLLCNSQNLEAHVLPSRVQQAPERGESGVAARGAGGVDTL